MKKMIALLLAVCMLLTFAACNNQPDNPGTSDPANDPKPSESNPKPSESDPVLQNYTWDVTVVFAHYDAKGGEVPPAVTLTEKANAENTLTLDPLATLGAMEGDVVDFTPLLDASNNVVLDGELNTVSATFDEADWTVSDNERGSIFSFEVVTPLTEGDYDTHGELLVTAAAPDYIWEVTVIFGEGTEGTYQFTNPGLSDWEEKYIAQVFEVTPDNNTFELPVFNHSSWIVDNTPSWYQWGVYDVDDVCPYIQYTVVTKLTAGERLTHGQLTITLSVTPFE